MIDMIEIIDIIDIIDMIMQQLTVEEYICKFPPVNLQRTRSDFPSLCEDVDTPVESLVSKVK